MRFSVAIALLVEGFCRRQGLPVWMQLCATLLSVALSAGYMTPIAAAIGLICHVLIWFRLGANSVAAIIIFLDITALAFLGPGGYSVDACRFGRRLLVPPPRGPEIRM
jgi:hypothetical protein